jgi:hypothetical protein
MSGEIQVTPGLVLESGELLTYDKLNKMVRDAVLRIMAGAVGARELADGSINADKIDADLSAQLGVQDGSVTSAKIVDQAVTDAKLLDMAAYSVKGRAGTTAGAPSNIAAASNGHVLIRDAAGLLFRALTQADVTGLTAAIAGPVAGVKSAWGDFGMTIASGAAQTSHVVTFAAGFFTATPVILLTPIHMSPFPNAYGFQWTINRNSTTGFTTYFGRSGSPAAESSISFNWMAFGT